MPRRLSADAWQARFGPPDDLLQNPEFAALCAEARETRKELLAARLSHVERRRRLHAEWRGLEQGVWQAFPHSLVELPSGVTIRCAHPYVARAKEIIFDILFPARQRGRYWPQVAAQLRRLSTQRRTRWLRQKDQQQREDVIGIRAEDGPGGSPKTR